MPFREATALVCVEREGIMETWVRKISGREPVLEIPVKGSMRPTCLFRCWPYAPRREVQPTALADLGKPAFKLGIAEISVGWREHD